MYRALFTALQKPNQNHKRGTRYFITCINNQFNELMNYHFTHKMVQYKSSNIYCKLLLICWLVLTSTTEVWPVKMVWASITRCSLGFWLMSHKQIVWNQRDIKSHFIYFSFLFINKKSYFIYKQEIIDHIYFIHDRLKHWVDVHSSWDSMISHICKQK